MCLPGSSCRRKCKIFLLWCPWVWKQYKVITPYSGVLHNKAVALRDTTKGILYYERQCRWTLNILQQDRQCKYDVTLRRVLATIVEVEKQWVLYNRSVCFCNLQCACAMLPCVAYPALQYFSTLSHKRHDFRNNDIELNVCFGGFFLNLSEIFFIARITVRDMIESVYWS